MPRANLNALLGNVDDPLATAAPETSAGDAPSVPVESSEPAPAKPTKLVAPRPASRPRSTAPAEPALYLRLIRKETRLRDDQQNRLTVEARRLNRAKATGGSRITDNTLIRIAVDLLLDRISGAHGDDEEALRESLKS